MQLQNYVMEIMKLDSFLHSFVRSFVHLYFSNTRYNNSPTSVLLGLFTFSISSVKYYRSEMHAITSRNKRYPFYIYFSIEGIWLLLEIVSVGRAVC